MRNVGQMSFLSSMKVISRRIWILSLISLFTDTASEMLYPVMPIYLKSIGFSILLIGVLEGVAEAVAGLSKSYFGRLSDHSGRRAPFVQIGYTFSALSKPLLALSTWPVWVFLTRTLDRTGKGIRTGARDAMLSDEATAATKGQVFGFHRGMDTLGAVIGPAAALVFLHFFPQRYLPLFYLAFIPGILAVGLTFVLKDKKGVQPNPSPRPGFRESLAYWKKSPDLYRKLVVALLLFALFNSSDVFLLLQIRAAGFSDTQVIGVYIFYNLCYAALAYPAGILGDRFGLKKSFLVGLVLFALVYIGMAFCTAGWQMLVLFFGYGAYAACTEGNVKAWVSNVVKPADTATAIGMLSGFQSISALFASAFAGFIWYQLGASATFLLTAGMTLVVVLLVSRLRERA